MIGDGVSQFISNLLLDRLAVVGKIQERYGVAKDAAEKQVDEFTQAYTSDDLAKAAKSS